VSFATPKQHPAASGTAQLSAAAQLSWRKLRLGAEEEGSIHGRLGSSSLPPPNHSRLAKFWVYALQRERLSPDLGDRKRYPASRTMALARMNFAVRWSTSSVRTKFSLAVASPSRDDSARAQSHSLELHQAPIVTRGSSGMV
jgi:hypothetical protein